MSNESDAAILLLESGSPDGYLLEDSSGVLLKDPQDYGALVVDDGAICYFRFNEASGTFIDSIGGRVGTPHGSIAYSQTGALVGETDTAIGISDTTMYVTLPGEAALTPKGNSNNLTVEAWASFAASGGSTRGIISFSTPFSEWTVEMVRLDESTLSTLSTALDSANASLWNIQNHHVTCDPLLFHYLAVVADGSTSHTRFYVDGVLVPGADQAWTGTGVPKTWASNSLVIGLDGALGSETLNGVLDELAIYPTALTDDQIARHYRCGLQFLPDIPPPVRLAAH